jgi:hypothetical protein
LGLGAWRWCRLWGEPCRRADTYFGGWGADGYVAGDFDFEFVFVFFGVLEELDVDCACAEAELDIFYFQRCGAGRCASEEGELD